MATGSRSPGLGKCQAKSQGRSKFQADGWQRRGLAFAAVAATRGKAGLAVAADRTQVELRPNPHRQGKAQGRCFRLALLDLGVAQSKRLNRQLAETVQPFDPCQSRGPRHFRTRCGFRGIAWNGSLRPAVCPAVPDQCPILRPRRGLGASRSGPVSPGSSVYRCAVRSTRSVAL
jgi:hypothetical protein